MFDPTKEVPSLELCKKLKELGYPQGNDGYFWLIYSKDDVELVFCYDVKSVCFYSFERKCIIIVSGQEKNKIQLIKAPTVRELGEWLPSEFDYKEFGMDEEASLRVYFYQEFWEGKIDCGYYNQIVKRVEYISFVEDTETNARAKMLIWLIENGYVSFKKES